MTLLFLNGMLLVIFLFILSTLNTYVRIIHKLKIAGKYYIPPPFFIGKPPFYRTQSYTFYF